MHCVSVFGLLFYCGTTVEGIDEGNYNIVLIRETMLCVNHSIFTSGGKFTLLVLQ